MNRDALIRRIESCRDIDPQAVDDVLAFLRDTEAGKNALSTHDPRTSASIDAFGDLDEAAHRELVQIWNSSAPVFGADSRA